MKKIAILGITGSIGTSTIEVVREHHDEFKIVFATSNNNYKKLFSLAQEFQIPEIVITNKQLEKKVNDTPTETKIHYGQESMQEALKSLECDIVVNAISGSAGLQSSITTINNGVNLALANKESLVMAGHIIIKEIEEKNVNLLPIDSEHSAILQSIGGASLSEIRSIIITASGGPFLELPLAKFKDITLQQTLDHPNWDMGVKISIDSATMMNKALEVIEAHWLFKKKYSEITAVIHPQSIIHSLIEFVDGSIISQMSFPTMKLPILYAISYPRHIRSNLTRTKVHKLPDLTFEKVSKDKYPLYFFARDIGVEGGLLPTIMNSANEAAIKLFSDKKIHFTNIYELIKNATLRENNIKSPSIDEIMNANEEIYTKTLREYRDLI